MFDYDAIRLVHLELTTRCNALCPMCRRVDEGRVTPGLGLRDLSLAELKAIFPEDFLRQLRQIDLCGVYGDPVFARSFEDALAWFIEVNPALDLNINTNGGMRQVQWWGELARRFRSLRMIFAIDGLSDTHAIYRRGTSFERVVENARAFIDAGGRAQWDFLVFRHNEHQVEEARRLAGDWGFEIFLPKYSGRFYRGYYETDPRLGDDEKWERFPIHDENREIVGYLEPPSKPEYVNPAYVRMAEHFARDGSLVAHWDATEICCSVIENQSIFVAADGTVFPCCWTYSAALNRALAGSEDPLDNRMEELLRRHGGRTAIDGRQHALRAICQSELFKAIAASWKER
ncbi:MAG TPA: radical SAM protein, partial [Stellaceae bacterium]|nr:radical SAM protein [Stellaceae bacterium]